jgi:hypothetical protein
MASNPLIFRRSPRIVITQKGYASITEEGVEFVRKRYSCSVVLESGEIKLYEFLIRLLSLGGSLPLSLIKRWLETEILRKAQESRYVAVIASRPESPKKEVQKIIEEIWEEIPRGIYV